MFSKSQGEKIKNDFRKKKIVKNSRCHSSNANKKINISETIKYLCIRKFMDKEKFEDVRKSD